MYTDTHFHCLEMQKKDFSSEYIRGLFRPEQISLAIDVAINGIEDYHERRDLLAGIPGVFFSIGYHPGRTGSIDPDAAAARIASVLQDEQIVAIGEIGMDFHHDFGSEQEQADLFEAQIRTANAENLPIIIHNRQASPAVERILRRTPPRAGGIMHCFEGDTATAARFLDAGLHISFAGNLTFKRNSALRETLRTIPRDRLLLETDSPYLTPEPKRGRPNHPGRIAHTYSLAAAELARPLPELCELIKHNTLHLFGIAGAT